MKILGMSPLGWINLIFLQYFFVRLAKVVNTEEETELVVRYTIIKWVIPWTGWVWSGKYIYLFSHKEKRRTRCLKVCVAIFNIACFITSVLALITFLATNYNPDWLITSLYAFMFWMTSLNCIILLEE